MWFIWSTACRFLRIPLVSRFILQLISQLFFLYKATHTILISLAMTMFFCFTCFHATTYQQGEERRGEKRRRKEKRNEENRREQTILSSPSESLFEKAKIKKNNKNDKMTMIVVITTFPGQQRVVTQRDYLSTEKF